MTLARQKTWSTETLTVADINAEFDNIIDNEFTIGWPADRARSLSSQALVLDSGGLSNLRASSDNILVLTLNGSTAETWTGSSNDGTRAVSWIFPTSSDVTLTATGSTTHHGIDIIPKGTGGVKIDGFRANGLTDGNGLACARFFSGI